MKNIITIGIIALTLLAAAGAAASDVVQGECLFYDSAKKVVKLREYDTRISEEFRYGRPTAVESELDLTHARIGIPPEPKDILRIAYDTKGSLKVGLKVMNVSKQDLMKK